MHRRFLALACAGLLVAGVAAAQQPGTASGSGTIDRERDDQARPGQTVTQKLPFTARAAWAHKKIVGGKSYTTIVLADREPPLRTWRLAANLDEALQQWCEREKGSFVSVVLTPEAEVDLTYLCPGDGGVNVEMTSVANGLPSSAVTITQRDARHVAGRLRMGRGSCPGADGAATYCEPTGDFTFDAPIDP